MRQRDARTLPLLRVDRQGVLVPDMVWGLWLLTLGVLVWRSGFLPRFLGVWLGVNGGAYMATSCTGLLAPEHLGLVSTIATPILFGEVAFTVWLLAVGVRQRPATAAAP